MPISFPGHVVLGHAVQLFVNNGSKSLQGKLIPSPPIVEELCDFGRRRSAHGKSTWICSGEETWPSGCQNRGKSLPQRSWSFHAPRCLGIGCISRNDLSGHRFSDAPLDQKFER